MHSESCFVKSYGFRLSSSLKRKHASTRGSAVRKGSSPSRPSFYAPKWPRMGSRQISQVLASACLISTARQSATMSSNHGQLVPCFGARAPQHSITDDSLYALLYPVLGLEPVSQDEDMPAVPPSGLYNGHLRLADILQEALATVNDDVGDDHSGVSPSRSTGNQPQGSSACSGTHQVLRQ